MPPKKATLGKKATAAVKKDMSNLSLVGAIKVQHSLTSECWPSEPCESHLRGKHSMSDQNSIGTV